MVDWSKHLYYDPTVGGCLRWKTDRTTGKYNHITTVRAGTPAGGLYLDYYIFSFENAQYRSHRIVWEMHFGEIPEGMCIDHINGDTTNNRVENLRLGDFAMNARNQKLASNNASGKTGVVYCSVNRGEYYYWAAQWYDLNGKQKKKHFSILRYGEAEAFRLACEWRAKMIEQLNAEGAGYTEDHGKR